MRYCTSCKREDAPFWEQAPCSCGAAQPHSEPNLQSHKADCKAIGHEVVSYPVRMERREFSVDGNADLQLPAKWKRDGWQLMQNGSKLYRVKLLCRGCIEKYAERQASQKEYERMCKAARGIDTMTYAQMLASQ